MAIFRHSFRFQLRPFINSNPAYILFFTLIGYGWLVFRTAWINDDALITVRTVENFLNGDGLRWNIHERVQTYTHPLWMMFLLLLIGVTNEFFYTILYFSILVSIGAVSLLLLQKPGGLSAKLLAVSILCFSQSFIDFSTSGLENPLTHLLLGSFIITCRVVDNALQRFAFLSIISCFAALNRLDTILICLPVLILACPWKTRWQSLGVLFLCFVPLIIWHLFSLFYYGFILPNTAYAKLNFGVFGIVYRILSGSHYLVHSLLSDPITLTGIGLAAVMAIPDKDRFRQALVGGVGLYLLYIVWIGGDFMSGRFLSAPLFVSAFTIASSRWLTGRMKTLLFWSISIAVGISGSHPPILTDHNYGKGWAKERLVDDHGMHNERAMFYQTNSLANANRSNPYQEHHPWARQGKEIRKGKERVRVVETIGHTGVFAGPDRHLVDVWGLADPLLARLPPAEHVFGHGTRIIPKDYYKTLQTDKNHLHDSRLAQYYQKLKRVVRGDLLATDRLKEIWNINTGKYDRLLKDYSYLQSDWIESTLEIANPDSDPVVIVYVQNEWRINSFVVDHNSHKGKKYRVRLFVGKNQIKMVGNRITEHKEFFELLPRSVFTLSVAILPRINAATYDIYEYRFPYYLSGREIFTLRHPLPYKIHHYPLARWEKSDVTQVIKLTRLL